VDLGVIMRARAEEETNDGQIVKFKEYIYVDKMTTRNGGYQVEKAGRACCMFSWQGYVLASLRFAVAVSLTLL